MEKLKATEPAYAALSDVKELPPPGAGEYAAWYRERFKADPPAIAENVDPATGESRFTVVMGYHMHTRPSECIPSMLRRVRELIPREKYYKLRVSNGDGGTTTLTPVSDVLDMFEDPNLFKCGKQVTVSAEGGTGRQWRRVAGWAFANVFGDPSFDLGLNAPVAEEKWARLEDTLHKAALRTG